METLLQAAIQVAAIQQENKKYKDVLFTFSLSKNNLSFTEILKLFEWISAHQENIQSIHLETLFYLFKQYRSLLVENFTRQFDAIMSMLNLATEQGEYQHAKALFLQTEKLIFNNPNYVNDIWQAALSKEHPFFRHLMTEQKLPERLFAQLIEEKAEIKYQNQKKNWLQSFWYWLSGKKAQQKEQFKKDFRQELAVAHAKTNQKKTKPIVKVQSSREFVLEIGTAAGSNLFKDIERTYNLECHKPFITPAPAILTPVKSKRPTLVISPQTPEDVDRLTATPSDVDKRSPFQTPSDVDQSATPSDVDRVSSKPTNIILAHTEKTEEGTLTHAISLKDALPEEACNQINQRMQDPQLQKQLMQFLLKMNQLSPSNSNQIEELPDSPAKTPSDVDATSNRPTPSPKKSNGKSPKKFFTEQGKSQYDSVARQLSFS